VRQINQAATLISNDLGHDNWHIAYQSRSGRPQDPWLEPDINDVLKDMRAQGVKHAVVVSIGFVCDNVEVLYDLDTEARQTAKNAGISFFRTKTVSDDPEYIDALAELVLEKQQS
jgi:ferrochelatase